jgi:hypothetical protein
MKFKNLFLLLVVSVLIFSFVANATAERYISDRSCHDENTKLIKYDDGAEEFVPCKYSLCGGGFCTGHNDMCVDTDSDVMSSAEEISYYVRGTTYYTDMIEDDPEPIYGPESDTDKCFSDGRMNEFFCDYGDRDRKNIECPYGCDIKEDVCYCMDDSVCPEGYSCNAIRMDEPEKKICTVECNENQDCGCYEMCVRNEENIGECKPWDRTLMPECTDGADTDCIGGYYCTDESMQCEINPNDYKCSFAPPATSNNNLLYTVLGIIIIAGIGGYWYYSKPKAKPKQRRRK